MDYLQPPKGHFLFTSESVSAGHPDKLSDFISDSILDALLQQDPDSLVACETCVKNNMCMVFGEVNSKAQVNYEQIVREAIKKVGYDDLKKGMDYKNCTIIVALDVQSPDIFQGLKTEQKVEELGAGDQGLMIGYATNETEEYMPITHLYAHQLCRRLRECMDKKILPWIQPDHKTQVTVEYKKTETGIQPVRVHTVLMSVQHTESITNEEIDAQIKEHVIKSVIPNKYIDEKTIFIINPSGRFIIGGPTGDSGLTGRKIIVDTYGGWGGHGGGAFSGKDPSKVDRSAAYAVRWVAKSLVANGFCDRCMVEIAYGIGVAHPISIYVNSLNTVKNGYCDEDLQDIVLRNFDLRPGCIIRDLRLKRPIYNQTAQYGHFGRNEPDFTWEVVKDLSHEKK